MIIFILLSKADIAELMKEIGLKENQILDIQIYINRTGAMPPTILDDLDKDKAKSLKALIRREAGGKYIFFFPMSFN
jgi:hypothetical protein